MLLLITLLALAAGLFAACADGNGSGGAPRLVLAGDSFDLGVVKAGASVERSVDFRNDGTQPLAVSIAKIRSATELGCECWVSKYEVRPPVVESGATGQLVFKLKAPEGMREMEDTMLADLRANDPERSSVTISLKFRMTP